MERRKRALICIARRTLLLARKRSSLVVVSVVTCTVSAHAGQTLYRTDWTNGIDPRLIVQANPRDLATVDDPTGQYQRVLRARIDRSGDFSRIANGAPRAEVILPVRFAQGKTYRIGWSTLLPLGTRFDTRQFVIVMQIHQGPVTGGPPAVALAMQDSRFGITQRGGLTPRKASAGQWICCAEKDIGKWVKWDLLYRASDSGHGVLTELRRNGVLVFRAFDLPNAYPGDQQAYLKIGLYKPDWKLKGTDVQSVSVLYGPVTIAQE